MGVVVGTLTIDLKANTASFSQAMDKMSHLSAKTSADIKRSLEKIGTIGLAMAAAVATGTAAVIMGALNAADAMNDLAQSTGSTTETLSKLKAGMNDLSTEELGNVLKKLNKAQFEAMNGNMELAATFTNLGVKSDDGAKHLRDSGQVLTDLAVKFAAMGASGNKQAIATQLMGKSAADIIPYLNQYGEAMEETNRETEQFGLVLDSATAAAAGETRDNLDRLHRLMEGVGRTLLAATLPAIRELVIRLIDVAKHADIPGMARSFGENVTTAVKALGAMLKFAVEHAQALKVALIALTGLKLASIAIPIIGQLTGAGGLKNVTGALNSMTMGLFALDKNLPVLAAFATRVRAISAATLVYARANGVAATATWAFNAALAANPILIAVGIPLAAIALISGAMYAFRDATFSAGNQIYKFLDAYNALVIVIKSKGLVGWDDALKSSKGKRLTEAKQEQDELNMLFLEDQKRKKDDNKPPPPNLHLKPVADPYLEEVAKLKLAIDAQEKYQAAATGTADQIAAAASKEKAEGVILEINTKLRNADRGALSATKAEHLRYLVALQESKTALTAFQGELIHQVDAAELATEQAKNMTAALQQGDEAVRQATIANALLAAGYKKTADQKKLLLEITPQLTAALQKQTAAETNQASQKALQGLQDELAARKLIIGAIGMQEAGQRRAALAAKLVPLDQQIKEAGPDTVGKLREQRAAMVALAAADDEETDARDLVGMRQELAIRTLSINAALQFAQAQREAALAGQLLAVNQAILESPDNAALKEKKDLIVKLAHAEWDEADARDAAALREPLEKRGEAEAHLKAMEEALRKNQKGVLTYGQAWVIAAKQQEIANQSIDDTVESLLKFGNAADGAKAFFLDMQKTAESAAAIIYKAMHMAVDKLSDEFTELITGGKADFAQMLKDIGKMMIHDTIKSVMQKGLAAFGKKFLGIDDLGAKPDGTEENPWHVKIVGDAAADLKKIPKVLTPEDPVAALDKCCKDDKPTEDLFKGMQQPVAKKPSVWDELLKGLIAGAGAAAGAGGGGDGGGGGEQWGADSNISYDSIVGGGGGEMFGADSSVTGYQEMAKGGVVSPSRAYVVGERGPEILSGVSGRITSNAESRRMLNAAPSAVYSIDARGTDPVLTEQRTRAAIMAAHNSAVDKSFQLREEHLKRTPHRR